MARLRRATEGQQGRKDSFSSGAGLRSFGGVSRNGLVSDAVDRVFIIHGRNGNAVRELSSFLTALGLEPWPFESVSARLGANPYVGEVVEEALTQARIVIALFTPDERAVLQRDFYHPADKDKDRRRFQSRPNVFFETGMALARARDRTIMVTAGDVELPSDFGGKLFYRLSNEEVPRRRFRELLASMGCRLRDGEEYLDAKKHGDFSDQALFGRETLQLPSSDSKGIDLLLGPGGVRCVAFAGALEAIVRNGYRIERICGISGGALMAASFAKDADPLALVELARRGDFLKGICPPSWWQSLRGLRWPFAAKKAIELEHLQALLGGDLAFSDLRIPLSVGALDASRGRPLAYTSDGHPNMKVAEALKASTAVPIYYPWLSDGDRMIVDLSIQTHCPVWLLSAFQAPRRNRAVALSVSVPDFQPPKNFGAYLGRLFQATGLATDHLEVLQSRRLVRVPIPVKDHGFLDTLDSDERAELVTQGREAIEQAIQIGLFEMPERPPRIRPHNERNHHDAAEAEARNAAIRYAREVQRFSSELDDE